MDTSADLLAAISRVLECDGGWLLTGQGMPPTAAESSQPHPDDADRQPGFVYVPKYAVEPSGEGFSIQSSQLVDHLAFKRDWVEGELRAQPENLLLIPCTSDAMEPTLRSGDLLLVDRADEKKREDGIFLIHIEGGLYVRRVERRFDGVLVIRGDNPATSSEERIPRNQADKLDLIGRVVWTGRKI
ncbi:MAG: helix-turn-helix transcriptional regulator [Nitrospinaceae bacterium]